MISSETGKWSGWKIKWRAWRLEAFHQLSMLWIPYSCSVRVCSLILISMLNRWRRWTKSEGKRTWERNRASKAVIEAAGGETPPPSLEHQATIEAPSLSLSSNGRRKTYRCPYSQLVASAKPRCCVSFSHFCSDIITPCPSCAHA